MWSLDGNLQKMINKKNIVNYMKRSRNNLRQQKFGEVHVFVKDKMTNKISLEDVFSKINYLIPDHLISLVDVIYIGDFPFLNEKHSNASYMDGAIYISNEQDDEEDVLDDLVHEYSHAAEDQYQYDLYSDGKIENEFLGKRNKLELLLNYEGYKTDDVNFHNTSYDERTDIFLSQEVGYEKLSFLTIEVFPSAYSTTSLREYFGVGFEEYYLGDRKDLKRMCPNLYHKINTLDNDQFKKNN